MQVFDDETRRYLESLPAVRWVSGSRIYYEEWFRWECLRRYEEGDSPTELFREAGMSPELIGRKRIERAFDRWRIAAGVPSGGSAGRPPRRAVDVGDGDLLRQELLLLERLSNEVNRLARAVEALQSQPKRPGLDGIDDSPRPGLDQAGNDQSTGVAPMAANA